MLTQAETGRRASDLELVDAKRQPFWEPDPTPDLVRPRTRTEHRLRFWA